MPMVSNKWYNEAKPILDYIVCPIGIIFHFPKNSMRKILLFKLFILSIIPFKTHQIEYRQWL